ncbi:hypothetical protein D9M72_514410 [compost metagenome]
MDVFRRIFDNRLQEDRSGLLAAHQRDIGLVGLRNGATRLGDDLIDRLVDEAERHDRRLADCTGNRDVARGGAHAGDDDIRLDRLLLQRLQDLLARLLQRQAGKVDRTDIGDRSLAIRLNDEIDARLLGLCRREQPVAAGFED